ncbi:MAG: hypothetical protein HQ478_15235, partial [Chloroflexi bacterium]|nr:hypothetical protein [Chloroflexota bacterium]
MLPNLALIEPLQAREAVRTTDSIRLFPPSATAGSFDSGEINFTGQRRDANTGLGFYNARYYDSEIGRFISA